MDDQSNHDQPNHDQLTASWGELFSSGGMTLLVIYCSGVWLFAADGLMVATLLPVIVPELGGAELIGWAGALFQAIAIVAGAMSVFLVRKLRMSKTFLANILGFMIGCLISAFADNMLWFQFGRFFQALCGGALVTLAHIGITQILPTRLRVRAFALMSIVWGVAAFGAPMIGALFAEYANWRAAFIYAAIAGLIVGVAAFLAYRADRKSAQMTEKNGEPFPLVRLVLLTVGVGSIATASLFSSMWIALILVIIGVAASAMFVRRDTISGAFALMPSGSFNPFSAVGSALYFIFFAGAATVTMGVFGPLLLTEGFGVSPVMVGYLLFIAAAGWTLLAGILSGVAPAAEPRIIFWSAICIFASNPIIAVGFLSGNLWIIALGLFADGAGFGACWGLVLRRTTQHANQHENERISSAINNVQRAGLAFGAAFLSILVNGLGFEHLESPDHARQVGFWVMSVAGLIGLPALLAAFHLVRLPESDFQSLEAVAAGSEKSLAGAR